MRRWTMAGTGRVIGLVLGLVLGGAALAGQAPVRPAFEVASIRPNVGGSSGSSINGLPRSGVTATNVTVRTLVLAAYRVHRLRLVGGPDWIDRERFDIVAKGPDSSGTDLPAMWQSLLEERFKLRVRTELREQPVYHLVVARTDGRLGPQIARSATDCDAVDAARRAGTPPPLGPDGRVPCNVRASTMSDGQGIISITGRDLSRLATSLTQVATPDRLVVDRTGLTGGFDLELRWRAEPSPRTAPLGAPVEEPLSVFTALQEQLGLKLEPARAPVDVVVIDAVERPVPD